LKIITLVSITPDKIQTFSIVPRSPLMPHSSQFLPSSLHITFWFPSSLMEFCLFVYFTQLKWYSMYSYVKIHPCCVYHWVIPWYSWMYSILQMYYDLFIYSLDDQLWVASSVWLLWIRLMQELI
jgi:hypothetical protein